MEEYCIDAVRGLPSEYTGPHYAMLQNIQGTKPEDGLLALLDIREPLVKHFVSIAILEYGAMLMYFDASPNELHIQWCNMDDDTRSACCQWSAEWFWQKFASMSDTGRLKELHIQIAIQKDSVLPAEPNMLKL